MKEMKKGCLQLKQAFLSEIKGFAIEQRAQVGRMVSLSLNGFDRTVKEPNSISYAHLLLTTKWESLS